MYPFKQMDISFHKKIVFNFLPKQSRLFNDTWKKPLEKTGGEEENAGYLHFLLFLLYHREKSSNAFNLN